MSIFVDTSALYALLDRDDDMHARAAGTFERLLADEPLLTHNYVVVETSALVQRRLEPLALRALLHDLLPAVAVAWVTEDVHAAGVAALLAAGRRTVSLVDWVSFEVMRREQCDMAFAFDPDFTTQGFALVPTA